jgi:hypothetical protein
MLVIQRCNPKIVRLIISLFLSGLIDIAQTIVSDAISIGADDPRQRSSERRSCRHSNVRC